jgi:hypothetical protein
MLDQKKLSYVAYVDMLKGNDKLPAKRKLLHDECVEAYDAHIADVDDSDAE